MWSAGSVWSEVEWGGAGAEQGWSQTPSPPPVLDSQKVLLHFEFCHLNYPARIS